MENRNSRVLQPLKVGWLETAWLDLPGRQFREVQCQQAQHVDHRGTTNQIHGESRILRVAVGEEGEAAAIDHRRTEGGCRAFQNGTSGNHCYVENTANVSFRTGYSRCTSGPLRHALGPGRSGRGAGWQPARRLATAAIPCKRGSWPIANRPQLTKLPHNSAPCLA